jgi:uncharacterized protein (TIGR03067 family)
LRWISDTGKKAKRPMQLSDHNLNKLEAYLECKRGHWDSELFQGSWTIISAIQSGKEMKTLKGKKWKIISDQYKIHIKGDTNKLIKDNVKHEYELNQFTNPKRINIYIYKTINDESYITETINGIYNIQDNIITLCFNELKNKEYPDNYKPRTGDGRYIYILEKEKGIDKDKKSNKEKKKTNVITPSSYTLPKGEGIETIQPSTCFLKVGEGIVKIQPSPYPLPDGEGKLGDNNRAKIGSASKSTSCVNP